MAKLGGSGCTEIDAKIHVFVITYPSTLKWGAGGVNIRAAKFHVQRCQGSVQERRKSPNSLVYSVDMFWFVLVLWRSL